MSLTKCMICGDPTRPQQWVCARCEAAYGLDVPFAQWPAWAKALAEEEQQERRQERLHRRYEVQVYDDDRGRTPRGLPSQRGLEAAWELLREWGVDEDQLSYDP